jgi:CRP-like cAMP-binding protein
MGVSYRMRRSNALLAALGKGTDRRLRGALNPVSLVRGEVLCESGERISHVYFPEDSLISLRSMSEDHPGLEVASVGREGLIGVALALGEQTSSVRAVVLGAGTATRMTAASFRKELKRNPSLRRVVYRYVFSLITQIARSVVCHRFHVVEARLARWLLMAQDRLGVTEFLLTQEFLASVLGARRVGVTLAAGTLRQRQLIDYRRGRITILDRKGLSAAACPCYRSSRKAGANG